MSTKITSCGIIRDSEKPRVGVIGRSSLNADFFEDLFTSAIDLDFENACQEITEEVKRDFANRPDKVEDEIEVRMQELSDCFESHNYLLGDWIRYDDGMYIVDKNGKNGFAASYNTETGVICVEWSQTVKKCCHTSPCYMMADGSGPCGDLDTAGDSVVAYALQDDMLESQN